MNLQPEGLIHRVHRGKCGFPITYFPPKAETSSFALTMPGLTIPLNSGERHKQRGLKSLALYGLNDP